MGCTGLAGHWVVLVKIRLRAVFLLGSSIGRSAARQRWLHPTASASVRAGVLVAPRRHRPRQLQDAARGPQHGTGVPAVGLPLLVPGGRCRRRRRIPGTGRGPQRQHGRRWARVVVAGFPLSSSRRWGFHRAGARAAVHLAQDELVRGAFFFTMVEADLNHDPSRPDAPDTLAFLLGHEGEELSPSDRMVAVENRLHAGLRVPAPLPGAHRARPPLAVGALGRQEGEEVPGLLAVACHRRGVLPGEGARAGGVDVDIVRELARVLAGGDTRGEVGLDEHLVRRVRSEVRALRRGNRRDPGKLSSSKGLGTGNPRRSGGRRRANHSAASAGRTLLGVGLLHGQGT
uniref:Uncharacterized protein n=1 Tax=Triticum urartu TaxID=4572 RepID=A0A8R7TXJ8_TRIUA